MLITVLWALNDVDNSLNAAQSVDNFGSDVFRVDNCRFCLLKTADPAVCARITCAGSRARVDNFGFCVDKLCIMG